jgi:plasmid stabilization system protein ParE
MTSGHIFTARIDDDAVRFFEQASAEVEHERSWYRQRSATAEESFLRELDHAIEVVTEAPGRWPRHLAGTRRYVFPTFPFSLVYFTEQETVFVVALESEHKRPGYWRVRLARTR